jgi:hypothetical protein
MPELVMLLREMFSPVGGPQEDQADIDWLDDLKFFMDNDNKMLENFFFPAVKKHKEYAGHPSAYKIYVKPLKRCLEHYKEKYKVEDINSKFSEEAIVELAQRICKEQEGFMERGDYEAQ